MVGKEERGGIRYEGIVEEGRGGKTRKEKKKKKLKR